MYVWPMFMYCTGENERCTVCSFTYTGCIYICKLMHVYLKQKHYKHTYIATYVPTCSKMHV